MSDTPNSLEPNEQLEASQTLQIPPIDFDGAWKETLTLMLHEALDEFAPGLSADIDWTAGYETLDTELQKLAPDTPFGTLAADKLFDVTLRDGTDMWLLVHIEGQSQRDPDFARRMYVYNTLLFGRYQRDVWSLAIFGDESADWKPTTYQRGRYGLHSTITYPTAKLMDYDMAVLDANPNPIIAVVLAHRTAQLTRRDMTLRAARRLELARRLFRLGYDQTMIDKIDRLMEWLLWLPPELKAQTRENIQAIRRENDMPFKTYGEEIERTEGKTEGLQTAIESILERRFGNDGRALTEQVRAITDTADLQALVVDVAVAPTLDEVQARLQSTQAK